MVQAALTPVDGQTAIGVTRTGTPVPAFGGPEASVAEVECQNDRQNQRRSFHNLSSSNIEFVITNSRYNTDSI